MIHFYKFKVSNNNRIIYGSLSGIGYNILNVILSFILTPYLIDTLGSILFGFWKLTRNYFNILGVFDGKNGVNLKYLVAKSLKQDSDEINSHLRNALILWQLTVLLLIGTSYLVFLVLKDEVVASGLEVQLDFLVLFLTLYVVFNSLLAIFLALLAGYNRIAFVNIINSVSTVFSNIALLLAVYMGFGLVGLSIGLAASVALILIYIIYFIVKSYPDLKISLFQFSGVTGFRQYTKNSLWLFLWSLFIKVSMTIEILLAPILFEINVVTNLTVSMLIFTLSNSVSLAVSSSFIPAMGQSMTKESNDHFLKLTSDAQAIINLLAGFAAIFVLVFNKYVVAYWVGSDYFIGDVENAALSLLTYQFALIRNKGQILDLLNLTRFKVILAFVSISLLLFSVFTIGNSNILSLLISVFISRELIRFVFNYKFFVNQYKSFTRFLKPNFITVCTYLTVLLFTYNLNNLDTLSNRLLTFSLFFMTMVIYYRLTIIEFIKKRFEK